MQGIISWLFDNSLSKDKKICNALITKCFFLSHLSQINIGRIKYLIIPSLAHELCVAVMLLYFSFDVFLVFVLLHCCILVSISFLFLCLQ